MLGAFYIKIASLERASLLRNLAHHHHEDDPMSDEVDQEQPPVEEEQKDDAPLEESPSAPADDTTTKEANASALKAAQTKKYRLISGEEVLPNGEAKPSTLAFTGYYTLGAVVLGVHLLFANGINAGDNASTALKIVDFLMGITGSEEVPIGFVLVMAAITWFNRMLNTATSGRWVTIALLIATFAPIIIQFDNLLGWIAELLGKEFGDYIPFGYNYTIFGAAWFAIFSFLVWSYQRSFSYAVTSDAVIFQHSFLLSRSHRRILFDRISEVMVERTPMGTLAGFATLTILTDSGVGLVDDSVGMTVGAAPSNDNSGSTDPVSSVKKKLLRRFFALLSYQRTTRRVAADPKHCFYKIRNWENLKLMLNEKHKATSQSNLIEELKAAIQTK